MCYIAVWICGAESFFENPSASPEIPLFLSNRRFIYRVHKNPSQYTAMTQMNPERILIRRCL